MTNFIVGINKVIDEDCVKTSNRYLMGICYTAPTMKYLCRKYQEINRKYHPSDANSNIGNVIRIKLLNEAEKEEK